MRQGNIRDLEDHEVDALLSLDIPAYLATIDAQGFPRVTPIWFMWSQGLFYMTSYASKLHVKDLQRNPRCGLCVELEKINADGARPNWQVRVAGAARLYADAKGTWTRRISTKYMQGNDAQQQIARRAASDRLVIELAPQRLAGLGSGDRFDTASA